jgi:hypothetical protein
MVLFERRPAPPLDAYVEQLCYWEGLPGPAFGSACQLFTIIRWIASGRMRHVAGSLLLVLQFSM